MINPNKQDLLQQIDDAASQISGSYYPNKHRYSVVHQASFSPRIHTSEVGQKSPREHLEAIRLNQKKLARLDNPSRLGGPPSDYGNLNSPPAGRNFYQESSRSNNKDPEGMSKMFDPKKTMTGQFMKQSRKQNQTTLQEDLRSVHSEYDYGKKKSFLDVLGQTQVIKTRANGGSGLNHLPLGHQIIYMDDEGQNFKKDRHDGMDRTYNSFFKEKEKLKTLQTQLTQQHEDTELSLADQAAKIQYYTKKEADGLNRKRLGLTTMAITEKPSPTSQKRFHSVQKFRASNTIQADDTYPLDSNFQDQSTMEQLQSLNNSVEIDGKKLHGERGDLRLKIIDENSSMNNSPSQSLEEKQLRKIQELKIKQSEIFAQQQKQLDQLEKQRLDSLLLSKLQKQYFPSDLNSKFKQLNINNPKNVTNGESSLNIASKYLFSGRPFDDLSPQQKITLFQQLNADSPASGSITCQEKSQKLVNSKKKKMVRNFHDNSSEFKDLSYLHKANRAVSWLAQDSATENFSAKSKQFNSTKNSTFMGMKSKGFNYQPKVLPPQLTPNKLDNRTSVLEALNRDTLQMLKNHTARKKLSQPPQHSRNEVDKFQKIPAIQKGNSMTKTFYPKREPINVELLRNYNNSQLQRISPSQKLRCLSPPPVHMHTSGDQIGSQRELSQKDTRLLSLVQRVPDNMIGQSLRNATKMTQHINVELMKEQTKNKKGFTDKGVQPRSNSKPVKFPTTTNQEFQDIASWEKVSNPLLRPHLGERRNFKRNSEFSSYVNATFNQGVYQMPNYDQL